MRSTQKSQEGYVVRKFTVDEYYRMGEVGIFSPDERLELLEGEIIVMPPMRKQHLGPMTIIDRRFQQNIDEETGHHVGAMPRVVG